jgi:hypothetical protein
MPIPTPKKSEKEDEYISRCISAIADEYDAEGQAYAVCKGEWDKPEHMAAIPIEIIGDNEEKILKYLPIVRPKETESAYISRCIPVVYPEYVSQQLATSLCADRYQRKITISDTGKQNVDMSKMSPFERKQLEFQVQLALKSLREKGIPLHFAEEGGGSYPWEECIDDQLARYGDMETAQKVCGYIKSEYGS